MPYREMDLDLLGKLPDFECIMKNQQIPEAVAKNVEDPARFQLTREQKKRKKRQSPKKVSREVIFDRISCFLDGFEVELEDSESEGEEDHIDDTPDSINLESNE